MGERQIRGEIEARQSMAIVVWLAQQLAIAQLAGIQVREIRVEDRGVVEAERLVTQRGGDQHAFCGRNAQRHPTTLAHRPVRVGIDDGSGEGINVIHVPAVSAIPGADTKAHQVAHDGPASRCAPFVARTAVLCRRRLDTCLAAELSQARLMQQQAHRSSLGAFTEQRSLGPTQDLDTIDIEKQRTDFAEVALQAVERSIVDEDAGRRPPPGVVHAANRQVRRDPRADRSVEVVFDARGQSGNLLEALSARQSHGFGRPDHETDGDVAHPLLAARCQHHDFFERLSNRSRLLDGVRPRCLGGGHQHVDTDCPVVDERVTQAGARKQFDQGLRG